MRTSHDPHRPADPVPRFTRGIVAALTTSAVIASGCAFGLATPAAAADADVVSVDFSQSTGEVRGGASGMLYGLSDDGVPTDAIIAGALARNVTQKAPKGAQHPNGDPLVVEDAFFDNGGEYIMTNIQDYYADWPYTGGQRPADFSTYLDIVRTVVTDIRDNSDHPEKYVFTPFNEPDGGNWYADWGRMKDTFLADWKITYETIKEVYPEARIAGMGDTGWQSVRTRDILTYAVANNVVPDMFTWHELGRGSLASFRSHLADYRQIEQDLGISPRPINITEYAMRRDMSVPGNLVQWLAMFEDEKVDAQTAYWTYAGNLNDNMAKGNSANGAWWLLKWYGDLAGNTVELTPPALNSPDTVQGIAALDADKKQATVLFGGSDNAVKLDLTGLDPAVFGDTVDIQVRASEWSGQEGEAQAPPVVAVQRARLGETVEIDVPNSDRLSAYQAIITPALPVQPAVDTTWRTSIEAEDTVLRDVVAYDKAPTDDWTFTASGGRDVGSTNRVSSALDWTVDVPTAGTYRFGAIAGVNGSEIGPGQHALFVDGVQAATISYEAGFGWAYRGRGETTIDLTAGSHVLSVRMSADGATLLPGSDISLDAFDLTRVDGPETTNYPAVLARTGDASIDYAGGDDGTVLVQGDDGATFYPSVRSTGYYDVSVQYDTAAAATLGLTINGRPVSGLAADSAGTWTSTARVHLAKGISELTVTSPDGAGISSVTTTRAAEADSNTVTIEAEDSSLVTINGDARIESISQPTNVSGTQLGWLGGNSASYATVQRPSQFAAGQYDLSVRYANAEKNTGHAYNTDVITRFLDVQEAGGTSTRGAFRNNYSWNGFWTHTVPLELSTADGSLRIGNDSGFAPNIDWLQLSPLVLGTTNTAAPSDPVITAKTDSALPGENGWTRGATTLSLQSSREDASIQYRVDGGDWKAYGSEPLSFVVDGRYTVDHRALLGDLPISSSVGTTAVAVDATAPITTAITDPPGGTATAGTAITATFSAIDTGSGVARTEYAIDDGAWGPVPAAGVTFTEVGGYTVHYRSVDTAGNSEAASRVVLTVAPKATTAAVAITSADPASSAGWYTQSIIVKLTPPTGTTAQYRINGGTWTAYRTPVTVSANGQHSFDHRLLRAGKTIEGSAAQSVLKVDRVAPTVAVLREPTSGAGTPLNPIDLAFSGSDAHSGLAQLEYRVNGGSWAVPENGRIRLDVVGEYVLSYRSTDVAGNTSPTKSTTVVITSNSPAALKASAGSATRGKTLTVAVTGFARWSDVTFTIGTEVIGTTVADKNGSAKVTLRVPAQLPVGPATITASGEPGIVATLPLSVK